MINSRNINDLHPYVKYLAEQLISKASEQGLKVLVTSTLRDDEYQGTLYAQGRSKPGQVVTMLKYPGAHGKGLAFDVCQNIKGREWEDTFFEKVGRIGVSLGLEWGGNWKNFVDRPHFQFTQGLTNEQIRAGMLPIFPKIPVPPPPAPEHWSEPYFKRLTETYGIKISERRFEDPVTRGEIFVLLCRMMDKLSSTSK
jgi:peptidoglycan L-alanyl-D-glutamate endopeptidase CwlK